MFARRRWFDRVGGGRYTGLHQRPRTASATIGSTYGMASLSFSRRGTATFSGTDATVPAGGVPTSRRVVGSSHLPQPHPHEAHDHQHHHRTYHEKREEEIAAMDEQARAHELETAAEGGALASPSPPPGPGTTTPPPPLPKTTAPHTSSSSNSSGSVFDPAALERQEENKQLRLRADKIARALGLQTPHVLFAMRAMDKGATVPFLARYRRDATGGMDEMQITTVKKRAKELATVDKRVDLIAENLRDRGLLTPTLLEALAQCNTNAALDDLYAPYHEKRQSVADMGRERGLQILAKRILFTPMGTPAAELALFEAVLAKDRIVDGAPRFIVALLEESLRQCEAAREVADTLVRTRGVFTSTLDVSKRKSVRKKMNESDWRALATTFRPYEDYHCPLGSMTATAFLAIQRGCAKGALTSNITCPDDVQKTIASVLLRHFQGFTRFKGLMNTQQSESFSAVAAAAAGEGRGRGRGRGLKITPNGQLAPVGSPVALLRQALKDAVKNFIRLAAASARRDLKMLSDRESIAFFALNLRRLLLQRPMPEPVLAMDPGYKAGIKCIVLDATMQPTLKFVANLREPDKLKQAVRTCVEKYNISKILIGNGTGSRETEFLVSASIEENALDASYAIVSEAGASVYSASPQAAEEFPKLDILYRGAVSIGRRVQDPISELVKIPVKSLGIGLYQHDINENLLLEELRETTQSCVSIVGVSIETASKYLLQTVPGLTPRLAETIYHNRLRVRSRVDLLRVPGMTDEVYTAVAGFLRVVNSPEPLDRTMVHPESYGAARKLLRELDVTIEERGKVKEVFAGRVRAQMKIALEEHRQQRAGAALTKEGAAQLAAAAHASTLEALASACGCGVETTKQLIQALSLEALDPRMTLKHSGVFRRNVVSPHQLRTGDRVAGVVLNVTALGVFFDIGVGTPTLLMLRGANPFSIGLNVGDVVEDLVVEVLGGDESDNVTGGSDDGEASGAAAEGGSHHHSKNAAAPKHPFRIRFDRYKVRNAEEFASVDNGGFHRVMADIASERRALFPAQLPSHWLQSCLARYGAKPFGGLTSLSATFE